MAGSYSLYSFILILFLPCLPLPFLSLVLCSLNWSWTYYVVKDNLELQIPRPPPQCSGHKCVPSLGNLIKWVVNARQVLYQLNYIPGPCFSYWLVTLLCHEGWPGTCGFRWFSCPSFQSSWEHMSMPLCSALLLFNTCGIYSAPSFFTVILISFIFVFLVNLLRTLPILLVISKSSVSLNFSHFSAFHQSNCCYL